MQKLKTYNGNGQPTVKDVPTLLHFGFINETALKHIKKNTGIEFKPYLGNNDILIANPNSCQQVVKLFTTYNFKTKYYNNWDYKNTIHLKSDHHVGFQLDDVCYDCLERNHVIKPVGLKPGDILAC